MAIANTTLQIRKSGTPGVKPTALANGELAINFADDKLYYTNKLGNISYFYGANNGPGFAAANVNNTLILSTIPNDTLSFISGNNATITACTTTKTITVNAILDPAFNAANSAASFANSAYTKANTGGTFTGAVHITDGTQSITDQSGALIVDGGVGILKNLNVGGDALITGSLTVIGGVTTANSTTVTYVNPYITLHDPTGNTWITGNDGDDIGIMYEYYDPLGASYVVLGGSGNGTTATLTLSDHHVTPVGQVITIAGVTPSGFNGTFIVTASSISSVSFLNPTNGSVDTSGALGTARRVTQFSMDSGTWSSQVANVAFTLGSPSVTLPTGKYITVTDCSPAAYNGTYTILASGPGYITYKIGNPNPGPITSPGKVTLENRHAFSGWSNDSGYFEYYKSGNFDASGSFGGLYGGIKAGALIASPPQSISATDLTAGGFLQVPSTTVYDSSSPTNGVVTQVSSVASLGITTVGAANANVTYTNSATLYIAGAPVAGNNVTMAGNTYALEVASGKSWFSGDVEFHSANGITFFDGTKQTTNAAPYSYSFSGYTQANNAASFANGAFTLANTNATNITTIQGVDVTQNTNITSAQSFANGAFLAANSGASFANGAFLAANSGASFANGAFLAANSGASFANGAFLAANSGASFANGAFVQANNISSYANAQIAIISGVDATQNTNIASAQSFANGAFTAANTAQSAATSAGSFANGAFTVANTATTNIVTIQGVDVTQNTNIASAQSFANGAFVTANSAASFANGAFSAANTKLSASGFTNNGVMYANGSGYVVNGSALTFDGTNFATTGSVTASGGLRSLNANGVSDTDGTRNITMTASYTASTPGFGTTTNHPFMFVVNGSEQMRLTSTGLGIGTSSPTSTLSVEGTFNVKNFSVLDTLGASQLFGGTSTRYTLFGNGTGSASILFYGHTHPTQAQNAEIRAGNAIRMKFDSSGNIGIGNTTPATLLSIGSGAGSGGYGGGVYLNRGASEYNFYEASDGTNSIIFGLDNTLSNAKIGSVNSYPIGFYTGNQERARIGSDGTFGIGTTGGVNADGNLAVAGSIGTGQGATNTVAQINIWETTSGNKAGLWLGSMTNQNTAVIGSRTATGNIAFQTYNGGWGERMRLTYDGNLLVGTASLASGFSTYAQIEASGTTGGVLINSATNNIGRLMFTNNNTSGNEGLIRYDGSNSSMQFWTAAGERVRIDASGNVGIGTSSPSYKLDVNGSGRFTPPAVNDQGFFVTSASGAVNHYFDVQLAPGGGAYSYLRMQFAGNNIISWGSVLSPFTNVLSLNSPSGPITFSANGSERMRLTANGGLAFNGASNYGTAGYVLQSNGDAPPTWVAAGSSTSLTSTYVGYGSGSNTLTGSAALTFDGTNLAVGASATADSALAYFNKSAGSSDNGITGSTLFLNAGAQTTTANLIRFNGAIAQALFYGRAANADAHVWGGSSSGELMRLTSTGLGIGTSSPSRRLSLDGGAGTQTWTGYQQAGTEKFVVGLDASGNPSLYGTQNAPMIFYTNNAERARIDSSGNFTLGNAVAGTNRVFNINGVANKAGRIVFQESGTDAWLIGNGAASENGNFEIYSATGNNFVFTRTGNLGIGISSPVASAAKFLQIAGATSSELRLQTTTTGTTVSDGFGVQMWSDSNVYLWNYENSATIFGTNGTERVRIDSSGNLLVGITSGSYKFMVGDGTRNMTINPNSSLDAIFLGTTTSKPLVFGTGDTERMRIDSSGNVGISTTSPSEKLHVSGTIRVDGGGNGIRVFQNGASTINSHIYFANSGNSAAYNWQLDENNNAAFWGYTSSWNKLLTITSAANFIIGATSARASSKLDIRGDIMTLGSNGSYYATIDYSAGTGFLSLASESGGGIIFKSGTTERARIDTSGNVGIGTSSPGYKLEVNGSFAATTKSFVIDHPTKPGMKLRYGSLEGPENGVYVRGRLKDCNKIELPEYWTKLVDPDSITVNLTSIGKSQELYVEDIVDNVVYIGGENINCFYTVFAERVDVDKLEVEIE